MILLFSITCLAHSFRDEEVKLVTTASACCSKYLVSMFNKFIGLSLWSMQLK